MIKLNRFLYIHFTTLLLFAVCYFNRNLEILFVNYSVIFLHELAHLLAALLIGLRPSHIIFYPFGVNLKLKNSLIYGISDEIILYFSGPFLNAILAFFAIFMSKYGNLWKTFYFSNLMQCIFNLLPILPMDGGMIAKKILTRMIGNKYSTIVLKIFSAILIILLTICEIYLLRQNNFTMIFVLVFLLGNIFTNKEKYHLDFTKELMYYEKKDDFKIKKAKVYIIKKDTDLRKLIQNFAFGKHYIIFEENKSGKIENTYTEREIIEKILK